MLKIKRFNESSYSMAAMIAPEYTKPFRNNEYSVKGIKITFPDTTVLTFKVSSENYYSDIVNYRITSDHGTLQEKYIKVYGDSIQMENYQEYVFVRCWNNPIDFTENDWSGYISKSDIDSGFNEVDMKFIIEDKNVDLEAFNNIYLSRFQLHSVMNHIISNVPNGINYKRLVILKRKFGSYLLDADEPQMVNIMDIKIDGVSLLSLIYYMQLKENETFKLFKMNNGKTVLCSISSLLDIIF